MSVHLVDGVEINTEAHAQVITLFLEERVEKVELENGGIAFVHHPKEKPERTAQSAADLPDNCEINSIIAYSIKLYRISIGPIEVSTPDYQPSHSVCRVTY